MEHSGYIVGTKSKWYFDGMRFVGYIVGAEGHTPDSAKVIKILEWPVCENKYNIYMFLGVYIYYCIWVEDFALITNPLYKLLKKSTEFLWTTK
jgi:hypothetical protein